MMRFFSKQPTEAHLKLKNIRPINFETGINYLFGLTDHENPKKAIKYLTKAAKSDPHAGLAACCLGFAYLKGTGKEVAPEAKRKGLALRTYIQNWGPTDEDRNANIEICKDGCIARNFELAIQFFKLGVEKGEENASRMLKDAISYLEETAKQKVSSTFDEEALEAVHSLYQYHYEQAEFYKNKYNILTHNELLLRQTIGVLSAGYIIIESPDKIIYPEDFKTQKNEDGCSRYLYHSKQVEHYQKIMHIHPQQIISDIVGGGGPDSCCVM